MGLFRGWQGKKKDERTHSIREREKWSKKDADHGVEERKGGGRDRFLEERPVRSL